jgi:pimeloyl-ACP methyl ester carboxylesterase
VTEAPLAYQYWGRIEDSERVVVLLHGVGGSRESWSDALSGTGRALAEAGLCAVALDLPGYGLSPRIDPYDIGSLAGSVLETMWSLQRHCAARIALVGHSMGGMVAQELVVTAPQQVDALVLMASSPAFGRADGAWQAEYLAQRLAPLDAGQSMGMVAAGLCKGMASANATHGAVARAAVLMGAVPEATYRAALHAICGFDRRDALGEILAPVLCLAGEDDRNAPPTMMKQMAARMPRAQYVCLPETGHLMHMESPQRVNPVLLDFLSTHL